MAEEARAGVGQDRGRALLQGGETCRIAAVILAGAGDPVGAVEAAMRARKFYQDAAELAGETPGQHVPDAQRGIDDGLLRQPELSRGVALDSHSTRAADIPFTVRPNFEVELARLANLTADQKGLAEGIFERAMTALGEPEQPREELDSYLRTLNLGRLFEAMARHHRTADTREGLIAARFRLANAVTFYEQAGQDGYARRAHFRLGDTCDALSHAFGLEAYQRLAKYHFEKAERLRSPIGGRFL
jgi:hypothetical protein